MLANLTPFKDHRTLIKAWPYVIKELAAQGRSAKLVLAGDLSVTYQDIKRLTLQLGIHDSVIFPGRVDDIHEMLASADIAAFCSNSEGCPNAVLESMAAGLPVAATDIPGIREVVGDEGVQYLAPPRDERKLAQVIISFAMNPDLRTIAGKANRTRIAQQFSVHRMNQEMSDLMNSLLRSKKDRRFSNGHP
jgi:glycosyltransferase involved in cell wall biosynthesis